MRQQTAPAPAVLTDNQYTQIILNHFLMSYFSNHVPSKAFISILILPHSKPKYQVPSLRQYPATLRKFLQCVPDPLGVCVNVSYKT